MSKTYGYNTAIRINGVAYRVNTGSVRDHCDTHDVTQTEGYFDSNGNPKRERGVGLGEAEISMSAFLDPEIALHVSPLNIRSQMRIALIEVYANGLDQDPDVFTDTLIDDVDKNPIGDPNQPNKVTFHGFCEEYIPAGD